MMRIPSYKFSSKEAFSVYIAFFYIFCDYALFDDFPSFFENHNKLHKFEFTRHNRDNMHTMYTDFSEEFSLTDAATYWEKALLTLKFASKREDIDSIVLDEFETLSLAKSVFHLNIPEFCNLLNDMTNNQNEHEVLWSIFDGTATLLQKVLKNDDLSICSIDSVLSYHNIHNYFFYDDARKLPLPSTMEQPLF